MLKQKILIISDYIFNREKDGDCHVSTYIENKSNVKGITTYSKNLDIEEAEIVKISEKDIKEVKTSKVEKKSPNETVEFQMKY